MRYKINRHHQWINTTKPKKNKKENVFSTFTTKLIINTDRQTQSKWAIILFFPSYFADNERKKNIEKKRLI